jgi:hypothetical protein
MEPLDLTGFLLMLKPFCAQNGLGEPVHYHRAMEVYQERFNVLLDHFQNGTELPSGFTLFIPDLWHIAKGRATSFPKEDGEELWQCTVKGHTLVKACGFVRFADGSTFTTEGGFETRVPGSLWGHTK